MSPDVHSRDRILRSASRLAALHASGLLSTSPDAFRESILTLASLALESPVALLNVVSTDTQIISSELNLPEPYRTLRHMPLTHSLCQYVVATGEMVSLPDLLADGPEPQRFEVADLSFRSYLGAAIRGEGNEALGALCVLDYIPRSWSQDDQNILEALAALVSNHVQNEGNAQHFGSVTPSQEDLRHLVDANLSILSVADFRAIILRLYAIQKNRRPH